MLTPRFLASAPEQIVLLYNQLETEILLDIVKRIGVIARATDINPAHSMFAQLSAFNKATASTIAKYAGVTSNELIALVNKSVITSLRTDEQVYKAMAAKGKLSRYVALADSNVLDKTTEVSGDIMSRRFKQRILDTQAAANMLLSQSITQVITAKQDAFFDFRTYMSKTIRKLGHMGITTVEESGRTLSMEGYVRREIITGVNSTAASASMDRAVEVDNDLVVTSSHYGARPEHALWQGKIFSLSGQSTKYPDFRTSTGYGTVTGLCGVNCRHSFSPYFAGYALKPDALDATQNKEQYEKEQMQRANERSIREWKRVNQLENSQDLDSTYSASKVREWQQKNRELVSSEDGLQRDYSREQIG